MNALIIEDEKAAVRNLKTAIKETGHCISIVGETDSIVDTVAWLRSNPEPDIVFMDIHLADGSAFEIFHHVEISCPIIFTTAYDEYAIQAFKVNSIDYLLKPITVSGLDAALKKLKRLSGCGHDKEDFAGLVNDILRKERYRTHFLVPIKADKFAPLSTDDILYFHISDGIVTAIDTNSKEYVLPLTLEELSSSLNPDRFFRANRQYILSRKSIKDIDIWFNNRLSVNLKVPTERILISKAKVNEFKEWLTTNNRLAGQ